MQNISIPPTKRITQIIEGQPKAEDAGLTSALIIVTIIPINAIRQKIRPITDAMARGAVENATIPSIE